jgi:hypothetical protein
MKTYRIYTPWDNITIEAKNAKQARIEAVKQLLYEIETDCGASLDIEEVEEETNGFDGVGAVDQTGI